MEKTRHWADRRGLIYEAYRIEGVTDSDCRAIFFDWALGVPASEDTNRLITALLEEYGDANPDHPMTAVLRAGLESAANTGRRGGWAARRGRTRRRPE